jgi:Spy/CpxP family protein refolding chaperone
MRRLSGICVAVAIALLSQAGAAFAQNKSNQQTGPTEQPGPFGFPGVKSMTERLMLSQEQHNALVAIYNEYKKQEQKLQQEKMKEAQQAKNPNNNNNNSNAPALPDAGTLKGSMIMEIRNILNDEQKKKFQEIVDDLSKKKKKNN